MFPYASPLIAFLTTAGAIPMCRALASMLKKGQVEGALPDPPRVAGEGMLCGVCLSLFYLHPELARSWLPLLGGMALAVIMTWLYRRYATRPAGDGYYVRVFAASLVAVGAVLLPAADALAGRSASSMVVAAGALLMPLALCAMGRARHDTPGLPQAVVLVQLLLLLMLGLMLGSAGGVLPAVSLPAVALTTIGALAAALVYLCRTPWRSAPAIAAGTGTRLCLGLLVCWTVLGLRSSAGEHANTGLLWILAVPVFELLRRLAVVVVRRPGTAGTAGTAGAGSGRERAHCHRFAPAHSPGAIVALTLAAGSIGMVMTHLQVLPHRSLAAILGALVVYWFLPILMQPLFGHGHARMVDV